LLQALQDGDFSPLGSVKLLSIHVWLTAATNHNIEEDIKAG
jgi:transcriptional regulator with GAF, ATPase, and Fis domain